MDLTLFASEAAHEAPFPILTVLVLVPLIGAIAVALTPARRPELSRGVGLMFSVAAGALSLFLLATFESGASGYQFVANRAWIADFGVSWHLGVDGISLFLVVLTGILFPLAMLGAAPHHDVKPFTAWLLLLEAGCMGVFLALDLLLFFVCFEIVLVPMYFLIGSWGHGNRVYAATKFFIFTMAGSALMLVAILATVFLHQQATGSPTPTFDLVAIAKDQAIDSGQALFLFAAFALAFAVKVPLFPLHTWLPDAHTEAPTAGSVILAGVLLKMGTYGFLRFGLDLFPSAAVTAAPYLLGLGVVGIVYGAIVAAMQKDLKRLVAYSSVAHLGFIVLGTFALTTQGLQGGLLQMVNHGLSTGALFFLVGWIYERRHTREISELKGLQKPAPIFAAVFTLVMLSSVGLPGLNGFVGEFLALLGAYLTYPTFSIIAGSGVILAAIYLLWAYQRVFHGEPDEANATFAELRVSEGLVLAPLLFLIVFMGVYPKPVLERMEPAVNRLIAHVEKHSDYTEPAAKRPVPVVCDEAEGGEHGAGHGEGC